MVIAAFSIMMLGLRSLYPGLRGVLYIAVGFFFGLPALALIAAQGVIAPRLLVFGAGPLVLLSAILLYRGVLRFCCETLGQSGLGLSPETARRINGPRDHQPILYAACFLSLLTFIVFAHGEVVLAPCVAALTWTLVLARGLMAIALFRCSGNRLQMRFFAFSMAFFTFGTAAFGIADIVHPQAFNILRQNPVETLRLIASLIFFCVQGVFYLLMYAGGVIESVHEQARRDYLSGILNRRGIEDALRSEIARRQRSGGSFAILLVDVDHFKAINDNFGHSVGDEALRRVARILCHSVREYDSVGRYGGDEFLILLPQMGGDDALVTASRIREAVRAERGLAEGLTLTASVGITCSSSFEELSAVVDRADAALYDAKHAGRDCERLLTQRKRDPLRSDAQLLPAIEPLERAG
jgi:diguanylate cyclase (GGDEF)-like protein